MRKLMFAAAALAALFAAPNAMASEACTASAAGRWTAAGKYTVEAFARGDTCEKAVAVIAIRDENGDPAFYEAYQTSMVMVLAEAKTPKDLEAALKTWIDPTQVTFKTTGDLPEWKAGAEAPEAGEFPFYPEEGIDQETYTKIRSAKSPMFCFVQGMESISCLVKDAENNGLFKVGVQSFPG